MKKLITLFMLLCTLISSAQTPKYGIVDVDSVLQSFPEVKILNQQLDSIRIATYNAIEPLQAQLQEKRFMVELLAPNDTLKLKSINEDAELIYQEINLVQQKASRAMNNIYQQGNPFIDKVNESIKNLAERENLTFIMPKRQIPMYTRIGLELYIENPLYYAGEAVDITPILIEELNPKKSKK